MLACGHLDGAEYSEPDEGTVQGSSACGRPCLGEHLVGNAAQLHEGVVICVGAEREVVAIRGTRLQP